MKAKDYNRMIEHCIKQYDIQNAADVYVCMQWYDEDKLYPIFCWDCDRQSKVMYVISGREPLTYSKYCGPQPIWINKDGYREHDIVHHTWRLSDLIRWIDPNESESEVKFLISTSPENIIGEINPHRTYMVKNSDDDSFIVLCWDSRDSGEGPSNEAQFTFDRIKDYCLHNGCSPDAENAVNCCCDYENEKE